METLFPSHLDNPVAALIQDGEEEPNPLTRRINQLVGLNESRERVTQNLISY